MTRAFLAHCLSPARERKLFDFFAIEVGLAAMLYSNLDMSFADQNFIKVGFGASQDLPCLLGAYDSAASF
jgi:hypothetical protein